MAEPAHVLVSSRLVLRPVNAQDVPALHRHWTDRSVRRYLWDDEVISFEQVEEIVRRSEQSFTERDYGLWAIRQADSDELLGCGGYWEFHDPPRLELVVSVAPAFWGQGFAAETGRLLLRYAFDELGFSEVRASTDAPNEASLRLIERLGFRYSCRAELGGLDTVFFTFQKEEFPRSR